LRLERIDDAIERHAIDEALFDQERFERFDPQREIGGNGLRSVVLWHGCKSCLCARDDSGGACRPGLQKPASSSEVWQLQHRTPLNTARIGATLTRSALDGSGGL